MCRFKLPLIASSRTSERNIGEVLVTLTNVCNHSCRREGPRSHALSTRMFVTLVVLPERPLATSVFQVMELGRGTMELSTTTHDDVGLSGVTLSTPTSTRYRGTTTFPSVDCSGDVFFLVFKLSPSSFKFLLFPFLHFSSTIPLVTLLLS